MMPKNSYAQLIDHLNLSLIQATHIFLVKTTYVISKFIGMFTLLVTYYFRCDRKLRKSHCQRIVAIFYVVGTLTYFIISWLAGTLKKENGGQATERKISNRFTYSAYKTKSDERWW